VKDNSEHALNGKAKMHPLRIVGGKTDGTDDRPPIQIHPNELHSMAEDAEDHLIKASVPFFVRSGMLVRPVREALFDSRGKQTYTSSLVPVTPPNMREAMSAHIHWERFSKVEKFWLSVDPPKDLVEIMVSRRGNWAWLPISGVISTPTLRPDGSILAKPGYDEKTRLYVAGTVQLPNMPDKPTRRDAEDALDLLEGLIAEFPFADKPSMSVALSGIMTPTVRGSMDVVPAHVVRAHTAGTGKSYLFDIASAIASGTRCPIMTAGRDETETEKRLGAKALAGHPIINIDNVNGDLGGDNLCQLISQPSCDIRVLGTSLMPTIVNRSCIFATGNNIRLVGDMTRRSLICSLDSPFERPEERVFNGDPVGDVLRDRGLYIAACMTIVRAYMAAGSPAQKLKPMNGFEDWSRNVRSALVWLGKADPCETMTIAREEDPQLQQLSQFLSALKEEVGVGASRARTSGQLWELANEKSNFVGLGGNYEAERPLLAESLSSWVRGKSFSGQWFGRWLNSVKGRIIDGHKLSSIRDNHKKTMAWYAESVTKA
jgi:putative DNA primase/helicase